MAKLIRVLTEMTGTRGIVRRSERGNPALLTGVGRMYIYRILPVQNGRGVRAFPARWGL